METAAAMADLRVVARTSACRVAGGLVALEDAGPADALAGEEEQGALAGEPPGPSAPLAWPSVCPGGATKSAPEGLFPPASLWAKKVFLSGTHPNKCVPRSSRACTHKIAIGDSDLINVCIGPLCELKSDISRGQRSAMSGLMHRSKIQAYSIPSFAIVSTLRKVPQFGT